MASETFKVHLESISKSIAANCCFLPARIAFHLAMAATLYTVVAYGSVNIGELIFLAYLGGSIARFLVSPVLESLREEERKANLAFYALTAPLCFILVALISTNEILFYSTPAMFVALPSIIEVALTRKVQSVRASAIV